jgi:hypothetical protein
MSYNKAIEAGSFGWHMRQLRRYIALQSVQVPVLVREYGRFKLDALGGIDPLLHKFIQVASFSVRDFRQSPNRPRMRCSR